jgi:hypothetical protein
LRRLVYLGALFLLSLLVCPLRAHAQSYARVYGFCEVGAQSLVVSGLTGTPDIQASYPHCTVTVYNSGTSVLATIYSDKGITPLANPFAGSSTSSYWYFYIPVCTEVDVVISGSGITTPLTYGDILSSGCSGGGGSANWNTLTAGVNTNSGNFSALNASFLFGQSCVKGPRPYIDVTCYGAKGDNSTDDTTAITAAINASCATTISGQANHPDVFFPPGMYLVDQTQGSSTTPDLPSCSGLHLVGGGFTGGGAQFIASPQAEILVLPGASPSVAPVLGLYYPQNGATLTNLTISAYNQAVWVTASNIHFYNTCLSTAASGDTDNTPLKISNTFWVYFDGGCLQSGSSTLPVAIYDGEGGFGEGSGSIYITGSLLNGGGVQYLQKSADSQGPPGDFVFRNLTLENSSEPFFSISNPGGVSLPAVNGVTIDNVLMADASSPQPLVSYNVTGGSILTGVSVRISGGSSSNAIQVINGTTAENQISGCETNCAVRVVDGSGNLLGGAVSSNFYGFDYNVNTNDANRLRSDPFGANVDYGPAARFTASGSNFAKMSLDPALGLLFNGGTYGFDSNLYQTANLPGTLDIGFATLMPPTNVAGTATTGGTVPGGTYYYFVISCANGSCTPPYSAPSVASAAVVVSGSNNAVNLTWTAPQAASGTITNYLLFRCTSNVVGCINATTDIIIAGSGSTVSYTDTGAGWGCCWPNAPATGGMTSAHRFTYNALGINTLSPVANSISLGVGGFVGSITHADTANRTYTLPDANGTICLTATCGVTIKYFTADAQGSSIIIPANTIKVGSRIQISYQGEGDSGNNFAVEINGTGICSYASGGSLVSTQTLADIIATASNVLQVWCQTNNGPTNTAIVSDATFLSASYSASMTIGGVTGNAPNDAMVVTIFP